MADETYKIKVETHGDPSGAVAVKNVLKDTTEGFERNTAETLKSAGAQEKAGGAVEALGKRGSAAKDVYEGLNQTMHGGEAAVFGAAKAWHNLTEAIEKNPLAATAAVLLALKPAVDSVVEHFTAIDRKLYGTGVRTEAVREGFAKLGDQAEKSSAKTSKAVDTTTAAFGRLLETQKANADALDKFADAEAELALAKLDREEKLALGATDNPAEQEVIKARFAQQRSQLTKEAEDRKLVRANTESERQTKTLDNERAGIDGIQKGLDARARELDAEARTAARVAKGIRTDENLIAAAQAREEARLAKKEADENREKTRPRRSAIDAEINRLSDERETNEIRRRTVATKAETETFTNAEAQNRAETVLGGTRNAGAIAPELTAIARRAGATVLDPKNRKTADDAVTAIGDLAKKLGDGRDDAAELGKIVQAFERLAAQTGKTRGYAELVRRIQNIESQLQNGER